MFYLGLIVSVCFVPGYTGAIIPTQWAVLSIVLPLGLWRSGALGPSALAGLAALAWSAISLAWAPNTYDAGFGLWLMCIWALALWFGSTIDDFRPLWQGLAIGLTVSSAIAIAQHLGFAPVLAHTAERPTGLFFNSTLMGASAALVIIALVSQRQWFYIPGVLPALILSGSRGAFLVLTLALLTRWLRVRYILCSMAIAALFLVLAVGDLTGDSDTTRLTIWGAALRQLTFWGHGIGSFTTFYIATSSRMLYPGWVHNDYLQLWFELGIGALAIFWLYALALSQRSSDHWPIIFSFTLFGLFYFPLWTPLPAFMACMAAGAMLRDRHLDRIACTHGRLVGLPLHPRRVPLFPRLGRQALPSASPT
jgi:hypothetical protein